MTGQGDVTNSKEKTNQTNKKTFGLKIARRLNQKRCGLSFCFTILMDVIQLGNFGGRY